MIRVHKMASGIEGIVTAVRGTALTAALSRSNAEPTRLYHRIMRCAAARLGTAALLLLLCVAAAPLPPLPTGRRQQDDLAAAANPLAGVPALPKVHHSWPLAVNFTDPAMRPVLEDYARITHAVAAGALFWTPTQAVMDVAVEICAKTGAVLEFEYSPWGEDASPYPRSALPMYTGPEEAAEIALFTRRCQATKQLIVAANAKFGTNISIGALLLDQERWCADCYAYLNVTNVTEAVYRAAITRKNNLFYSAAQTCAPGADIELYNRGAVGRGSGPGAVVESTGWRTPGGYYTVEADELPGAAGAFATALYTLSEVGYTRESFNRTAALARAAGVPSVTPWLSLGAAYRRNFCKHDCASPMSYDENWNYDLAYSWMAGAEINDPWYGDRPQRFADWHMATAVAFYPSVFSLVNTDDNRRGANSSSPVPVIMQHFVAYCQGAAGIVPPGQQEMV